MPKLLFVNACLKGEASRTLRICRAFLEECEKGGIEIEEIELAKLRPQPLTWEQVEQREKLIAERRFDEDIFALARQYKAADYVVFGAPYWDFSFPAVLKAYIEHICAADLTFCYTESGMEGLACADKTIYITTAGGFLAGKDFGTEYIKGVSELLGCFDFSSVSAEALDIIGMDAEARVASAVEAAVKLAKELTKN